MKKKKYDDDDGRTVADMNVDGMPWYKSAKRRKQENDIKALQLSKKEKRAIMRASFLYALKIIGIVVVGMGITFLLMWLWVGNK